MDAINRNRISTEVTEADREYGKGKSAAQLAQAILDDLPLSQPYGTTFIDSIPYERRKAAEAELKKAFELWANSWIAPRCRAIVAKATASARTTQPPAAS